MVNVSETKGRRRKNVDAEMFLQFVVYYKGKKGNQVPTPESRLFEFCQRFSDIAESFEAIKAKKEELTTQNPEADEEKICELLEDDFYIAPDFKFDGITLETFDYNREKSNNALIRLGINFMGHQYFDARDIEHANTLFQSINKDASRKLMQRVRKLKFQEVNKYTNRKVSIDIDSDAFNLIKAFGDKYGFKTHSYAIRVMAEKADDNYRGNEY
jgi:hypothetical protein